MVSIRKVVVHLAFMGLVVGVAHVSGAAQPQKAQPRQPEMTGRMGNPEMILRGPVIAVNAAAGFIVVRHGAGKEAEEIPVEVDSKTSLTRGGQRATVDAVKPGDSATVHYSGSPGNVAKMVAVTPGKGAPAAKPAKAKTPTKKPA